MNKRGISRFFVFDKKGQANFWDYLIWIGIVVLIGWALLKAFGIINSPEWVNMIPVLAGGASLAGGAYKLGMIMRGIEGTKNKINEVLEIKEDFRIVKQNQKLCMDGKLQNSPFRKRY